MLYSNRAFVLSSLALVSLFSSSCSKKKDDTPSPTASFSYAASFNNNTHAPATVAFTNTSTNASTYAWNFGDGSTSTSTSPSHKYATAGTFTVSLTSTSGSKTTMATQTVNILPAYTKAKVTRFTLVSTTQAFPFTGFFRITNSSNTEVFKSPNLAFNAPGTYTPPTPPILANLSSTYYVEVWKYNQFSADVKLSFTPVLLSLMNTGTSTVGSYPTNPRAATGSGLEYTLLWE